MGVFWVSGGQLGLKSLSIRLHVSFPDDQNRPQTRFLEVRLVRSSKNAQKTGIIDASTLRTSCFAIENGGLQDGHPPAPQSWPNMALRYTLTSCNLPLRGPHGQRCIDPEWKQEDVMDNFS